MKMNSRKTIFTIAMALVAITSISFWGCKKDKVEFEVNKYFTVTGGEAVEEEFPEGKSGGPAISNFGGNTYVLPGGSNLISVQSESDFSSVLIGIEGKGGYYKVPATTSKSTLSSALVTLMLSTQLPDSTFNIVVALQNSSETTGIVRTLGVSLIEAGTGKLQVSLSWEKAQDVDLYLVEPGGETIYYGSGISSNGGNLDVDSNAGCGIDNINNENITYGDESVVIAGEYIVRVNLWSECGVTERNNYVVSARVNGSIVTSTINSNPYISFFPENSDGLGGGIDAGTEVIKFNVAPSKEFATQTYARFNFNNNVKVKRSDK